VVDWKTNDIQQADVLALSEGYRGQIAAYRAAFQRCSGRKFQPRFTQRLPENGWRMRTQRWMRRGRRLAVHLTLWKLRYYRSVHFDALPRAED
jgi:hypothetical protein